MMKDPVTTNLNNPISNTHPIELAPDLILGGNDVLLMAGPCSVESYAQTHAVAETLFNMGVRVLRGGAFKPRTSPHSFQGLGEEGLKILRDVADEFEMLVISEALGVDNMALIQDYSDIIQIGSRNMQHFPLLWAAGESEKPVLLKRGYMSTIEEWLLAAEHIMSRGNEKIILCERGIRSFDTATRNVLDTGAIALAKDMSHFPVIADPSHATGRTDLVLSASRAAVAAGADGLLVETHPDPENALSDGQQSLPLEWMPEYAIEVRKIASAMERGLI